jgi:hypothetical protein
MIEVNTVHVAIIWCIAGLSVICAINARGFFRQVVSWLIVIAIAFVAILFSYLKVETVKQEIGLNEISNTGSSSTIDTSSVAVNAANDSLMANYIAIEKQLLENTIAISDSILSFPDWKDIYSKGIEKRENFESKARSLRNKSANFYRQIRNLTPPEEKKQSYDLLLSTAENLQLAGYKIHNQFSLEADTLGESIVNAREYAHRAKSVISIMMNKE